MRDFQIPEPVEIRSVTLISSASKSDADEIMVDDLILENGVFKEIEDVGITPGEFALCLMQLAYEAQRQAK